MIYKNNVIGKSTKFLKSFLTVNFHFEEKYQKDVYPK